MNDSAFFHMLVLFFFPFVVVRRFRFSELYF